MFDSNTTVTTWELGNHSNISNISNSAGDACDGAHVSTEKVIYTMFMVMIMFCSIIGNLLVITAVFISPSLKEKPSALLIASLACSDFAFALILIPFRISSFVHGSRFCGPLALCYIYMIVDVILNIASITTLLIIAVDRYIAISYPFKYQDHVTNTCARNVILTTWSTALLWSFLGTFRWETGNEWSIKIGWSCHNKNTEYYMVSSGFYLTSLLAMTVIYLKILFIAVEHATAIAKATKYNGQAKTMLEKTDSKTSGTASHQAPSSRGRKKEMKSTKTLALVYGAFVVCWLPSVIINAILFSDAKKLFGNLKRDYPGVFLFVYYAFIEVLPVLNTAINPFIYSFSNTQLRNAFKRVVMKVLQKHSVTQNEGLNSLAVRLTTYFATDEMM